MFGNGADSNDVETRHSLFFCQFDCCFLIANTDIKGGCDVGTFGSFYDIAYYVASQDGSGLGISGITPLETFGSASGAIQLGRI